MIHRSTTNLMLLGISAAAVMAGLSARLAGHPGWADWIWLLGSVPVLLVVLVGIARAIGTASAKSSRLRPPVTAPSGLRANAIAPVIDSPAIRSRPASRR